MFEPKFVISQTILKNLTDIAEIKAIVERSKVLPLKEAKLRQQALIRMAHTSTSIEGNPLAEFEVEKVMEGKKVMAESRAIL